MKQRRKKRTMVLNGLVALGTAALLAWAAAAWCQGLTVSQPHQQLYSQPNFTSPPVGPVPQGSRVDLVRQEGDWYLVSFQGKSGWLHKVAVGTATSIPGGFSGFLTAGPVQEAKTDEVALAGKGFTPEVEAGYRQKHAHLNYAQVDAVERLQVEPAKLSAFLREGGLQ